MSTMETQEQCVKHRSSVLIVNFEQISQIVLVFPVFTLSKCPLGNLSLVLEEAVLWKILNSGV